MSVNKGVTFLISSLIFFSCSNNEKKTEDSISAKEPVVSMKSKIVMLEAQERFGVLPPVAESETNPLTEEKVLLGKKLYLDTQLSKDGNISCNSCHNLETFGVDRLPTSPGDKGENGDRNSPTTFNAALHRTQFWDGRAHDVEEQAGMPILNPVEMAIPSEDFLVSRLNKDKDYPTMFTAVFGEEGITYENIRLAIAAFERTLITPSRFDDFVGGNAAALTLEEQDGLMLFVKTGCTNCHNGVLLGGELFQKFPTYGKYEDYLKGKVDKGRFAVTGEAWEEFSFKVPSLRNIAETYPYFHNGEVEDLNTAIKIMAKSQLNKELSDADIASISVFLNSLTGELQ